MSMLYSLSSPCFSLEKNAFPRVAFSLKSPSFSCANSTVLNSYKFLISSSNYKFNAVSKTEYQSVVTGEVEFYDDKLLASNVPWTSTPEDIRSLFEKFGRVIDVELSMHNKAKNRGLAFVKMGSGEEARAALEALELSEFQGRTLKLNYAKPRKNVKSPPPAPRGLTFNLYVSNLAYEAKAKDLKQFFASEGFEPLSAEIIYQEDPRKSAGYGFVAFKSKRRADEALTSCQGKMFMERPIRVARSRHFGRLENKEAAKSVISSADSASLNTADAQM